MSNDITVMIVDDEPLAREGLKLHFTEVSGFKVIGACANASDALLSLEHLQPDVMFLDIEMPGMSGVEFASLLADKTSPPKIVFVTAFKEYALDAFGINAVDYLLKPFCEERFATCIAKLRKEFGLQDVADEYQKLASLMVRKTGDSLPKFIEKLENSEAGQLSKAQDVISVKSGTQWLRIALDTINWIEAAGDYMCIHTCDNTHIIRKTLKEFESDLASTLFIRVSRSAIINVNKVKRYTPNSNGEYFAHLCSGEEVKITRTYKHKVEELQQVDQQA